MYFVEKIVVTSSAEKEPCRLFSLAFFRKTIYSITLGPIMGPIKNDWALKD